MIPESENKAPRLDIRKYANRRYYDSTHSRHLTLEEIRTLVEKGYDIRVTDAKTKRDITGQVLVQILLELDTVKLDSLPVPLLVHLIRVNDQFIRSFVENYLYRSLQAFTEYQKQWQDHLKNAATLPGAFPGMTAWTNAMLQPFQASTGSDAADSEQSRRTSEGNDDLRTMVRELQEQVARLQQGRRQNSAKMGARRAAAKRSK